jgi:hypothetical protein
VQELVAHSLIRFGPTGWKVQAELPDPVNLEAATAFVTPGERGLLVPVRVRDFTPSGLLATRVYIDLVGLDAAEAIDALVRGCPTW